METMNPQELEQRFAPKHFEKEKSEEEIKAEIEKATEPEKIEPIKENPKYKEKYPFVFEWKDKRGMIWQGNFVNKIVSAGDRIKIGIMQSQLSGGTPYEALDPLTIELCMMIAHMTYSLIDRPEWAQNLRDINDIELLQALYGEVVSHEDTFHGYEDAKAESKG